MNKETILLVDDDDIMREFLATYLEEQNYNVIQVDNGEQAVEIFESQKDTLNLIILDIILPILDGWSILRKIRKESKIPIIMITSRKEDELFAFELGADEYINKPYYLKIVMTRIKAILESFKKLNSNY